MVEGESGDSPQNIKELDESASPHEDYLIEKEVCSNPGQLFLLECFKIAVDFTPELKGASAKLLSRNKRIHTISQAINEMYKRLESSFKIDRIVEMENMKLADIEKISHEQFDTLNILK